MKKHLSTLKTALCAAACLSLVLVGCGQQKNNASSNRTESSACSAASSSTEVESVESDLSSTPSSPEEEADAPTDLTALTAIAQDFLNAIESTGGTAAVTITDLSTGDTLSFSQGRMQAASLIKLYIAGAVYENQALLVSYGYDSETLASELEPMITISDNYAANALVAMLGNGDTDAGRSLVDAFCQKHGYPDTHMGGLLMEERVDDDNYTSTRDCGQFLWDIYHGNLAGSGEILDYMLQQTRVHKLPAGLPEGVVCANKTGELSDVENDVAIVYTPTGAYQISVMTEDLWNSLGAQQEITALSGAVYSYFAA